MSDEYDVYDNFGRRVGRLRRRPSFFEGCCCIIGLLLVGALVVGLDALNDTFKAARSTGACSHIEIQFSDDDVFIRNKNQFHAVVRTQLSEIDGHETIHTLWISSDQAQPISSIRNVEPSSVSSVTILGLREFAPSDREYLCSGISSNVSHR